MVVASACWLGLDLFVSNGVITSFVVDIKVGLIVRKFLVAREGL